MNEDSAEHGRADTAPGALLTRLPGRARPRKQALEEFEKQAEALRRRYKPVFWPFFIPKATEVFRWRVQLECGCVHELFRLGADDYPDGSAWLDPITRHPLPVGEIWCSGDHGGVEKAYRDVVEWIDSRVREFPPDPEECPHEGVDAETWARMRNPEPHSSAFWRVRLSCGHVCDHVIADVEWRPEHGPKLCTAERAAEMRSDFESMWAVAGYAGWPEEGPERDHVRKMLDLRWPRPEPEQECRTCRYARRITGYQRVGWLVPKEPPAAQGADPDEDMKRRKAETRLAKIEAEAQRLREQLGMTSDE